MSPDLAGGTEPLLFPRLADPANAGDVAVMTGDEAVTYGELAACARRIGDVLGDQGIRPGAAVGIIATTKAAWIALYVVCDQCGFVAVPIDPVTAEPEIMRLRQAVDLAALVCWQRPAPEELAEAGPVVLAIDGTLAGPAPQIRVIAAGPGEGRPGGLPPGQAVIFPTSGTTGASKQVVLSRTAITNILDAIAGMWGLRRSLRTISIAPLWLFASYQYTLATIRRSGTVVALDSLSPAAFVAAAADGPVRGPVRGTFLVPTHARLLRADWDSPGPADTRLEEILLGGEKLDEDLQDWLRATFPATRISVALGISEPGGQLTYLSDADRLRRPDSVGRALTGAKLSVVREDGSVATSGTGRLRCQTNRMMTGYLQSLGREWLDEDGGYLTEDVVRIDDDGFVYHLGRSSAMIRVGGRTIHPAEIDTVIKAAPGVRDACTVGVAVDAGGQAAITLAVLDDGEFSIAELTGRLNANLAPFKHPARIVRVPAIPRNANQKADLTAARLIAATADELDLPGIEPDATLISLGGDSLTALRVAQRANLRSASGLVDPGHPLLNTARPGDQAGADDSDVISRLPRSDLVTDRCWRGSSAQERLWYLENAEGDPWSYNAPLWLHLTGRVDRALLTSAFNSLVEDQPVLRCYFEPAASGLWMHGASREYWPALRWLTAESEAAATEILLADLRTTFDIRQPPLVRATCVSAGASHHLLGFACHHGLTDFSSGDVITHRIRSFYDGAEPGSLPRPLHPSAVAELEARYLASPAGAAARMWWADYLATMPAEPGPATGEPAANRTSLEWTPVGLPDPLRGCLRDVARRLNVTEFSITAFAFGLALKRVLGRAEVVVGIIDARRPALALSHTIGCYFNTLPVRIGDWYRPDLESLATRFVPELRGVLQHSRLPLGAITSKWTREHRARFRFDAIFQVTPANPSERSDKHGVGFRALSNYELPWNRWTAARTPFELHLSQPAMTGQLMTMSQRHTKASGRWIWPEFLGVLAALTGSAD